jgi:putative endonuclease
MYYVYLIKSDKINKIYTGVTRDLKKRIAQHNNKNSKYTSWNGPYRLIWYCAFMNKQRAYDFEIYLKSHSGSAFRNKRLI